MQNVKTLWKTADAVCFDVDSTVTTEEAIDELAKFCNKGKEVSELTAKAMSGSMTFQESLSLRLNIIQPSHNQVKNFIKSKLPPLTPGIKELINLLHERKVAVYLISGGFKSIISPIAQQLNIPVGNIFANRLKFYFDGEFAGFDEDAFTSKSGGKALVIENLKKQFNYKNLIHIGDGATDLEACPPADGFIGFGGVVVREQVKSKSQWFVTDFQELISELQ